MSENITGLVKIIGITVLLVVLWVILSIMVPDKFLTSNNIENLLRRTALYGILGIGVAFVIISAGIDLSIGSLVCLAGCLFAVFLEVSYVPMGEADVQSIDFDDNSMIVQSTKFVEGDEVWFLYNKRVRGIMRIHKAERAIKVEGKIVSRLFFEGDVEELKRFDARSEEMDMKIYPTYTILSIQDESIVRLEESAPKLRAKDKLRFVSLKAMKERAITSLTPAGAHLESPVSGVSNEFRWIPIRRKQFMTIPMALLSVLGIALGLGLLHGLLITKMKQQPFIITLCGLLIYRSIARSISNDQPKGFIEYSDSLGALANGRWIISGAGNEAFGIPYSFFFLMLLMVLAIVFLNYTVWGRYLKALGRNEEAARYSGINTGRITVLAYVICAMLAAVGGMMFAIDANSVPPSSFGNFFELYAIAAAVLGGCSLRGGEGSILGVVVGTALMQTLYNSIVLLGIPDTLEFTIIGAVILIGVVSDEVVRRLAGRIRGPQS